MTLLKISETLWQNPYLQGPASFVVPVIGQLFVDRVVQNGLNSAFHPQTPTAQLGIRSVSILTGTIAGIGLALVFGYFLPGVISIALGTAQFAAALWKFTHSKTSEQYFKEMPKDNQLPRYADDLISELLNKHPQSINQAKNSLVNEINTQQLKKLSDQLDLDVNAKESVIQLVKGFLIPELSCLSDQQIAKILQEVDPTNNLYQNLIQICAVNSKPENEEEVKNEIQYRCKIHREMKNANHTMLKHPLEDAILRILGYADKDDFSNHLEHANKYRNALYKKLNDHTLMKGHSQEKLQIELQESRLKAKVEMLPKKMLQNLARLVLDTEKIKNTLKSTTIQNIRQHISEKIHSQEIQKFICASLLGNIDRTIDSWINHVIKKQNSSLQKDLLLPPESFTQKIHQIDQEIQQSNQLNDRILKMGANTLNFYVKYEPLIKVHSVQGYNPQTEQFDENEVLGRGICCMKSLRVGLAQQKSPKTPVDQLQAEKITSADRVNQTLYRLQKKIELDSDAIDELLFPKLVRNRLCFNDVSSTVIGTLDFDLKEHVQKFNDWIDLIKNQTSVLNLSHGVFYLGLFLKESGAHAIDIRIDAEHNIVRLHDPNVGVLEISGNNFTEKTEHLKELFKDLLKYQYPDLHCSVVSQIKQIK